MLQLRWFRFNFAAGQGQKLGMSLPRAFTPLRHATFRMLWIATLASNIGLWIQNTGAGWLMTILNPDPMMVSLVQAASMLPVFLLALPAGALADIIDRRIFLIGAQAWILASSLLLALLTATDSLSPWGLLALTFAIGAGNAMNFPAWAATTPELLPKEDLVGAIALNGISFNIARAVGPAVGGFAIAFAGPEAAFVLNAVCFLWLIVVLVVWKPEARHQRMPPEHLVSAMRAGLRFVRATPAMHAAILRSCVFFLFTAAIWGLMPLFVRQQLGLGPEAFGLMLAAMGCGAVAAGFGLPLARARFSRDQLVFGASLLAAAGMGILAVSHHWAPAIFGMVMFGAAWICAGATLSTAAQLACPSWVRARAIAIYQLCFFGAMALGSAFAGWLGGKFGVAPGLGVLAAGSAVSALLVRGWHLDHGAPSGGVQMAPDAPPIPKPAAAAAELRGLLHENANRVLEVVRYRIDPARRDEFLACMKDVRLVRLRGGAMLWRLYEDVANPDLYAELWAVETWTEHLREQGRQTPEDRAALAAAAAFQQAGAPEAARYVNVLH